MLERLLPFWRGKLFVLGLLGFAAHRLHHHHHPVGRRRQRPHGGEPARARASCTARSCGSPSAWSPCSARSSSRASPRRSAWPSSWSSTYLALNAVVIVVAAVPRRHRTGHVVTDWSSALTAEHGNLAMMIAVALDALPQAGPGHVGLRDRRGRDEPVEGDAGRRPRSDPPGRIRDTKRLLTIAALHHERLPDRSSLVTTLLIPAQEFEDGGAANGRALAYLAHEYLGDGFGTVYDVSTIAHPVVRRRLGDGRHAEPDPALPAPLRHGPGVGRRRPTAGARPHPDRVPHHLDLRRRRRRPGRRVRHRRPGADDLGRRRRHARRPPRRPAQADRRVRR